MLFYAAGTISTLATLAAATIPYGTNFTIWAVGTVPFKSYPILANEDNTLTMTTKSANTVTGVWLEDDTILINDSQYLRVVNQNFEIGSKESASKFSVYTNGIFENYLQYIENSAFVGLPNADYTIYNLTIASNSILFFLEKMVLKLEFSLTLSTKKSHFLKRQIIFPKCIIET